MKTILIHTVKPKTKTVNPKTVLLCSIILVFSITAVQYRLAEYMYIK